MAQKVLVLGASLKKDRYSNVALNMLLDYGHEVKALGNREGELRGVSIQTEKWTYTDLDTITLYLGPANQEDYKAYIIKLNPKRVIFNPGTENLEFENELKASEIETERACTLVLLRTNQFDQKELA
jgi:predicted CoA-binding protein